MTQWIVDNLGCDVPIHFTAFHPDWKMRDKPRTPPATLSKARQIAKKNGIRHAYTGNVHDEQGSSTYCHACQKKLIGRDWFVLGEWNIIDQKCKFCHTPCPGNWENKPGNWGAQRKLVRLKDFG
jgi:pyruvate formate lyase activating enzyme